MCIRDRDFQAFAGRRGSDSCHEPDLSGPYRVSGPGQFSERDSGSYGGTPRSLLRGIPER
eukprot:13516770-Alexandrium_andersonii.AAC.1